MTGFRSVKWAGLLLGLLLYAQDSTELNQAVLDDTVKTLSFEVLDYPIAARLKQVQGTVVIRVNVDERGIVVSSSAVSGAKDLIPACLSNAKKWRFQRGSAKTAILVYQFKIDGGICRLPCASQFIFTPPNVATITIGTPLAQP